MNVRDKRCILDIGVFLLFIGLALDGCATKYLYKLPDGTTRSISSNSLDATAEAAIKCCLHGDCQAYASSWVARRPYQAEACDYMAEPIDAVGTQYDTSDLRIQHADRAVTFLIWCIAFGEQFAKMEWNHVKNQHAGYVDYGPYGHARDAATACKNELANYYDPSVDWMADVLDAVKAQASDGQILSLVCDSYMEVGFGYVVDKACDQLRLGLSAAPEVAAALADKHKASAFAAHEAENARIASELAETADSPDDSEGSGSDAEVQAEIQNIQAGVQQAQQANAASNQAFANAQQQINATVQRRAAGQAAQAQAAQAEQQRLAQERQQQLAAQQEQQEAERQREEQEAERQRQAAAEEKKNQLQRCVQQAQGFRLTYTDPWIARAKSLMFVIDLQIDTEPCRSESWGKCWQEIQKGAFLPPKSELEKWAKELNGIDTEFYALPEDHQKECRPLFQKCPGWVCYNTQDILQLYFWCSNRREDCVQQLTNAAGELQNASPIGSCVWTESTIWNQEKRCQSLYGAGQ